MVLSTLRRSWVPEYRTPLVFAPPSYRQGLGYGGILLLNLIPLAENVSEFNRDDHNGGVGDGPPARNREVGRCAMSERLDVIFRGKYSILRRLDAILIDFDVCVTVER